MAEHCASHEKFELDCADCKAARRETSLRFHDTHQVWSPCHNERIFFTDSPSMVQEANADGMPDPPRLIVPVQVTFQGERAKIFPVHCSCGKSYISFIDVVNRERLEQVRADLLPYYPQIAEDGDLRKRYLEPKRRDIILTPEQFADRVSRESNKFVREAIERKCDQAGLGIPWIRSRVAYGFNLPAGP